MTIYQAAATVAWLERVTLGRPALDQVVIAHREPGPGTFMGLGLIATGALVVWLIRRSRA